MRRHYRLLLMAAALFALAQDAQSQGLGIGIGLDDLHQRLGTGGAQPSCQQGKLDFSGACNAVYFVMGY